MLAVINASAGLFPSRDPGHLGMPGAGIRLASALHVFSPTGLSGEDTVCHQDVPSCLRGEAVRLAFPPLGLLRCGTAHYELAHVLQQA